MSTLAPPTLLNGWTAAGKVIEPRTPERPLPLAAPEGHAERVAAWCAAYGEVLWFRAGLVDRMPPRFVEAVVAHEVAHALAYSTLNAPAPGPESEELVHRRLRDWGFDEAGMFDWMRRQG
jgi:hypothetical protein